MTTLTSMVLWMAAGFTMADDDVNVDVNVKAPGKRVIRVTLQSADSGLENEDGTHVRVKGKIVVVGPDSVRREINLSDLQSGSVLDLPEKIRHVLRGVHQAGDKDDEEPSEIHIEHEHVERYVIGVSATAVNALLRRHLKLADRGLVITAVRADTPAAAAGLQEGDLLLAVDNHPLNTVPDLVDVVRKCEGATIALRLLRDGDEMLVHVAPVLQRVHADTAHSTNWHNEQAPSPEELRIAVKRGLNDVWFRRIGPGLIMMKGSKPDISRIQVGAEDDSGITVGASAADDTQAQMQQLRDEITDLKKQLAELRARLPDE